MKPHRKRPENVKEQLEVLTKYAAIDKVLVWHANADTVFTFEHPKVCVCVCVCEFLSTRASACTANPLAPFICVKATINHPTSSTEACPWAMSNWAGNLPMARLRTSWTRLPTTSTGCPRASRAA